MQATQTLRLTLKLFLSIVTLAVILVSCSDEDKARLLKQNVSGKAGEIIVVTDKSNWETEPGIELRNVLAVECVPEDVPHPTANSRNSAATPHPPYGC